MTNPGAPGQVKSETRMTHSTRAVMAHSDFGLHSGFWFRHSCMKPRPLAVRPCVALPFQQFFASPHVLMGRGWVRGAFQSSKDAPHPRPLPAGTQGEGIAF